MDHQAFAQLLGNYGEFVGAIAVVATLASRGAASPEHPINPEFRCSRHTTRRAQHSV